MAFYDPPCNLPVEGFISRLGRANHREFLQGSGEMTPEHFHQFLVGALEALKRSVVDGALVAVSADIVWLEALWHALRDEALICS